MPWMHSALRCRVAGLLLLAPFCPIIIAVQANQGAGVELAVELAVELELESLAGDVEKIVVDDSNGIFVAIGPYMAQIRDLATGALLSTRTVEYPENRLQDVVLPVGSGLVAYLVTGEVNEVIFVDIVSGRRFDLAQRRVVDIDDAQGGRWILDAAGLPQHLALRMDRETAAVNRAAVAYARGDIYVREIGEETEPRRLVAQGSNFTDLWFDDDGRLLWAASNGLGVLEDNAEELITLVLNQGSYIVPGRPSAALVFVDDLVKTFELQEGGFVETGIWQMGGVRVARGRFDMLPVHSFSLWDRFVEQPGLRAVYVFSDQLFAVATTGRVASGVISGSTLSDLRDAEVTAVKYSRASDRLIVARGTAITMYRSFYQQ